MKFIPTEGRVLIRKFPTEEFTPAGLVIPKSIREEEISKGEVVESGFGKFKIGDKVVWSQFSGTKIKLGEEEFILLRSEDILGWIK